MLKFIQNNREITALLAVVLLFVLPGFLDRQYLSVQTLTMVYSSAQILILLAMGATLVMLMRKVVSAMISWIILSRATEPCQTKIRRSQCCCGRTIMVIFRREKVALLNVITITFSRRYLQITYKLTTLTGAACGIC